MKELNNRSVIGIVFGAMFVLYILLVAIWDTTSDDYKPENAIDLVVRTPVRESEFLVRGKNK